MNCRSLRTVFARFGVWILAALSLFPAHFAAAATSVGGPVISDTTWTIAGSPYIVVSSVIVGGNAT